MKHKELTKMYALGAISFQQYIDEFKYDTVEEFIEAFEYSKLYAELYDEYCCKQRQKERQIKRDWRKLDTERFFNKEYLDQMEATCNKEYFHNWKYINDYTQAINTIKRKENLDRIAIEAGSQGISPNTVQRFFKAYDLNNAEISRFWLLYNMTWMY